MTDYVRTILGATTPASEMFHGYNFRTVRTTGVTTVVAYPAKYGETGVMTFAVTPKLGPYEKELGPKTLESGGPLTQYKPDRTWHEAERQFPLRRPAPTRFPASSVRDSQPMAVLP
jgi:Protein of unknown function (DUF2950)